MTSSRQPNFPRLAPAAPRRATGWLARWLAVVAVVGLMAGSATPCLARGGGGHSSGGHSSSGHSYSSGSSHSSSFGRSSSSSGSSFGRSYSSGSHGSSSFSSSSHSNSPSGHSTTTAHSASGRSYSSSSNSPSGGSHFPGTSSSSGGGFSNPGSGSTTGHTSSFGRSYSSGGAAGTTSSGRSYSSSSPSSSTGSRRPTGGDSFDHLASTAQRKEASRALYTKGQTPKSTYVDERGNQRSLETTDRHVAELRRDLDHEKWVNRSYRQQQAFGSYYTPYIPSPYYYRDPFSSFFWSWLLVQSLDTRSHWAYNYQNSMDPQRYQALLNSNAQLAARVQTLETQNAPRDPNYKPPGLDGDLMYDDSYVNAAYNPQPTGGARRGAGHMLSTLLLFAGVMVLIVWLVFFKRWGGPTRLGRW